MNRRREEILRSEIEDHISREIEDHVARGMSPTDARAAALSKFGPVLRASEDTRAVWTWTWLERIGQDLRHGARMFAKNPGFTIVAVVSLALGIGANCAMFSAADALLLRPLPVAHAEEVVSVGARNYYGANNSLQCSYLDYLDLRERAHSFSGLVAFSPLRAAIARDRDAVAQVKAGAVISADFFSVLGVNMELGRGFRADEDQVPGRDPVVILSHDLWTDWLDANGDVIGRKARIGGIDFTIVGVAPEQFTGLDKFRKTVFYVPTAMWHALTPQVPQNPLETRSLRWLFLRGRLNPGVTIAQARAEVESIGRELTALHPESNQHQVFFARTEVEERIGQDPLDTELIGLLTFLAIAVLCVAGANVAGLLASRAPVRAREIALRLAIGAGRGRLIRQLLTESLMIAVAGELLSLPVAALGIHLFREIKFPMDGIAVPPIYLDLRAMFFALLIGLVSSVVFGLAPAIQTTRANLLSALKSSSSDSPRQRVWGRNLLVTAQVALSLMLLTVATFAYRTFQQELHGGIGFRPDHIAMLSFDVGLSGSDAGHARAFYSKLLAGARTLPGVSAAALASTIPMSYVETATIEPEGYRLPPGVDGISIDSSRVSDSYFDVMDVKILRGRAIETNDTQNNNVDAPRVAVINEVAARHYWPNQDPIGKRFRSGNRWFEIVGVAKTGRYLHIAEPPTEFVYFPSAQEPRMFTLIAQTTGDSAAMIGPLRELARSIDPSQPMFDVHTMEEFYWARAVGLANIITLLIASMGLTGLALAMIGLYGLVSYAVARRTREIGIRMAIGAARASMLRMILGQGLLRACYGLAIGCALSIAVGRVLPSLFPTTHGIDLWTYLLVPPALLAITALAVLIPARRASRVDPITALRHD